jgi:hypothetical protein
LSVKKILFSEGEYIIAHEYEQAYLRWPGGTYPLGDHYGDPTCAVMSILEGWCVTGGEGLVITWFEAGLPAAGDPAATGKVEQTALWRRRDSKPPPAGDPWYVFGVWLVGDTRVQAVVEPGTDHAGLYEVDVRTLAWRKV